MTDTVLQFPKLLNHLRGQSHDTAFTLQGTPIAESSASISDDGPQMKRVVGLNTIEIDKLYPATKESASDLISALGLLADAINLLEKARVASQKADPLESDRYSQRFQVILTRLFAYRKVGDGYAVIINSLQFAFINQKGKPLNLSQLTTVWRVMRELRNRPFIVLDEALNYVQEIEDSGMEVDPPILGEFLAMFEDE